MLSKNAMFNLGALPTKLWTRAFQMLELKKK